MSVRFGDAGDFSRRKLLLGGAGALIESTVPALRSFAGEAARHPAAEPLWRMLAEQSVSLTVNLVTGTLINIGFSTPNNNRPAHNMNMVHLWAASADQMPWDRVPQASVPVLGDIPVADQDLFDLQIGNTPYVIGYAVGPNLPGPIWSPYANVVATAYIPNDDSASPQYAYFSASLKLLFVGTTSLAANFAFPAGFQTAESGAWIGLWQQEAPSYDQPPAWFAPIKGEAESGTAGLNGIQIDRGKPYTLALYSSGYAAKPEDLQLARLACATIFTK
jgi:hypothetical protein